VRQGKADGVADKMTAPPNELVDANVASQAAVTRVLITGAAGLVGQNLIAALVDEPNLEIIGVDKHTANLAILRKMHPELLLIEADLSKSGAWENEAARADCIIMLHAQIGGLNPQEFEDNNVVATKLVMNQATSGTCRYVVHVSSSVVNSAAKDFYTESKKAQEALVETYDIAKVVLRPTLMFGWFDRKHVGWLHRFLHKSPIFPIPGSGRYLRQPLYAGDFSAIIAACLRARTTGHFNISGLARIDYIDMIAALKRVTKARAPIISIPYGLFRALLALYAVFDKNPPFTTAQLKALATPDIFEVIDWPTLFGVKPTPLEQAFEQTFLHPVYSKVVLEY
jgi:nucleoside-diphosphate-sugar epimerase